VQSGTLVFNDAVTGMGSAVVDGGCVLDFAAGASPSQITFNNGGGPTYGEIIFANESSLNGLNATINGFAGTNSSNSDIIDLAGTWTQESETSSGGNTTLVLVDSANGGETVTLTFDNFSGGLNLSSVGGSTEIVDPPARGVVLSAGATLSVSAPSCETVTFAGATGTLVVDQPASFSGQIDNFTGTAPDLAHSDVIDLIGLNYTSPQFGETYNTATGMLAVTDGQETATLKFDNFGGSFHFASDGSGGTLITDPPANNSANPSVSIGGPGNDSFVFHPSNSAGATDGSNVESDNSDLNHLNNVHTMQELAWLIANDAPSAAAVVEGGHGVTPFSGLATNLMQDHLHNLAHLH
jgi:hypothetical protein